MKESFAGVSFSVSGMGATMRETFEAVRAMREMRVEIGEAATASLVVEKIPDWTRELGEAAEPPWYAQLWENGEWESRH